MVGAFNMHETTEIHTKFSRKSEYEIPPPGATAHSGPGPPHHTALHDHTHLDITHLVGVLWAGDQSDADLHPTKQDIHKTDIHAPGEIRTRNPSKAAAVDPRLRQRDHWHLPEEEIPVGTSRRR